MIRIGGARGRSGWSPWWIRGVATAFAVAMLFLLMAGRSPATAQDGGAITEEARGEAAQAETSGVRPSVSDPLPSPAMQRAYWHVFTAFGIAWVLLLGYAVLLNRRVAQAERDLARLAGRGE